MRNKPAILLSREAFHEEVMKRSGGKCVFCEEKAVDAHHILDRKLWADGGYYVDNGAAVCEPHHLECEWTQRSVEEVREAAGIRNPIIPPHMEQGQRYDKWGNPILANGQRLRGELFDDPGVQKALHAGGFLGHFAPWVKYPRTPHFPWSEGVQSDDRVLKDPDAFSGQRVITTEKMDGENTTLYRDYLHARSVDGRSHPSRDWVKGFWGGIRNDIPDGWRICGENLFAEHSIAYDGLPSYFMGFAVWNQKNECLSWDDTLEWFHLLGITPVPVLYDGVFDEARIRSLWHPGEAECKEGTVTRLARAFDYAAFQRSVAKFVRAGHVQTDEHWMHGSIKKNKMRP